MEIAETTYQAGDWETPRRMIMVMQEIAARPKATSRQLKLLRMKASIGTTNTQVL
jgi:hypothetical protein